MADPIDGDRTLGAVAYLLHIITGILVLVMAKKRDKYARWHAIQAIGLGVTSIVGAIVIGSIERILLIGGSAFTPLTFGSGYLSLFWMVATIAAVLVLAYKAYGGHKVRLPFLGDIADTYA